MRNFSEEHRMFRSAYRRFVETEIEPNMERWKSEGIVDRMAFETSGENGYLLMWADREYGGLGIQDFRYEQIIIEEIQRLGCGAFYNTLHSRLVAPYIDAYGTEEQKKRFLIPAASGKSILGIAMTEPGAGSDLAGIKSSLKKTDDGYLLNGSKTYISNGINGDVFVVAAMNKSENDHHAMTLCIVERGMAGFERGRNLEKMGLKAQDTAELFFKDVVIPESNILGQPGKGFQYLMERLPEERLISATMIMASARRAFDLTRRFVMEREVFGKPIASMQNTQFKMAEMDAQIDVVQTYIDVCIASHNENQLDSVRAAKARLCAAELEWEMVDLGVQLHGGAGYMKEYPICEMFTDSRVNRIFAGTTEVMKMIIAREIFSDSYVSLFDQHLN